MKKVINILLVLLIIFDSFGYLFIYLELGYFFKKDGIGRIIDENSFNDCFVTIKINKSELKDISIFDDGEEIKFNEKMYDVVSRVDANDSITFYCLSDEKEDNLALSFDKYISEKTKPENSTNPIHNILHNFISIYYIDHDNNNIYLKSELIPVSPKTGFNFQTSPDIPTPPPKA